MFLVDKIYNCGYSAWNAVVNVKGDTLKQKIYNIGIAILDTVLPRNPVHKGREIRILPPCAENLLGHIVYLKTCSFYKVVTKGDDIKMIQDVFKRLVDVCDRRDLDFEIVLLEDKTINSFYTPGGKVWITTGIVEKLKQCLVDEKDEEQFSHLTFADKIAAVLGHEIAHACVGHTVRKIQFLACIALMGWGIGYILDKFLSKQSENSHDLKSAKKTVQTQSYAFSGFEKFWKVGEFFIGKQHSQKHELEDSQKHELEDSQKHELEADKHGIKYARKALYNIDASLWLQKKFLEIGHQKKLFSTHPPSNDRLEANKHTINEIKEKGIEEVFA